MDPKQKYRAYPDLPKFNRTWPERRIDTAPAWCSVDLRDGNQSLINPMTLDEKLEMFDELVRIGFKEIEVGFPSAAEVEFDFLRTLVDQKRIPDDVTLQVLCQSREHLIAKTFEAIQGVPNVIFHLYNSTSVQQREIVFKKDKPEIIDIALQGVRWIQEHEASYDGNLTLQYSPESFTGTEIEFSLEICEAVIDEWDKTHPESPKVIINLPATVELSTPNLYADLIEWFCQNTKYRERMIISLHTHNDRGTGVAATELALMAGADRVEGTLFGSGERTGNVDIITLALNMYTQGVNPKLDISDINRIIEVSDRCTKLPLWARHPYAGDLVYTAFSGSHQDAIKKGMAHQQGKDTPYWEVPYLPIDPEDVGRSYEAIIRINSQSGKGGMAYIMEQDYGCSLPKAMHPEFSKEVQHLADKTGKELSGSQLWNVFTETYLDLESPYKLIDYTIQQGSEKTVSCSLQIEINGEAFNLTGTGKGPIDACKQALRTKLDDFSIVSYHEHSLDQGAESRAIAYIQASQNHSSLFGVGIDENITTASIKALFSALNRLATS